VPSDIQASSIDNIPSKTGCAMGSSNDEVSEANLETHSSKASRWLGAAAAGALVLAPLVWLTIKGRATDHGSEVATAAVAEPAVTRPQDPEEFGQQLSLALTLLNVGNARASLAPLERCKQLQPNAFAVHNNFCVAYGLLERGSEAVAACRRALEIDPGSALAKNNLGWVSGIKPTVAQQ
jgi:Flp pilus assembly protein TadD